MTLSSVRDRDADRRRGPQARINHRTMKYDDATWHSGGEFPQDLKPEAGGTHVGLFLAWALLSGLAGALHLEEMTEELEELRRREITPGAFFLRHCDGKLTDDDLSDEGNAFAQSYYGTSDAPINYFADYGEALERDLPSLYHVPDTWDSFERLKPILDQRLSEWRATQAT